MKLINTVRPIVSFLIFLLILGTGSRLSAQEFRKGYAFTLSTEQGAVLGHFYSIDSVYLSPFYTTSTQSHIKKYGNLTLKRGVFSKPALFDEYQSAKQGNDNPQNLILTQFDDRGKKVKEWTVTEAIPVEADGFQLKSDGSGTVSYLKYKLDRCFVKSWSTSG